MCSETVATVETTAVAGPVVGDVRRVSGEVVLLLLEALFGVVACPCGLEAGADVTASAGGRV